MTISFSRWSRSRVELILRTASCSSVSWRRRCSSSSTRDVPSVDMQEIIAHEAVRAAPFSGRSRELSRFHFCAQLAQAAHDIFSIFGGQHPSRQGGRKAARRELFHPLFAQVGPDEQIGRASCRERV